MTGNIYRDTFYSLFRNETPFEVIDVILSFCLDEKTFVECVESYSFIIYKHHNKFNINALSCLIPIFNKRLDLEYIIQNFKPHKRFIQKTMNRAFDFNRKPIILRLSEKYTNPTPQKLIYSGYFDLLHKLHPSHRQSRYYEWICEQRFDQWIKLPDSEIDIRILSTFKDIIPDWLLIMLLERGFKNTVEYVLEWDRIHICKTYIMSQDPQEFHKYLCDKMSLTVVKSLEYDERDCPQIMRLYGYTSPVNLSRAEKELFSKESCMVRG